MPEDKRNSMRLVQQFKKISVKWIAAAAVFAICVVVGIWIFFGKPDTLKVPLGVEQAAIVTYSGSEITVAPYKWGVAVNVRIAKVIEKPDRRIYDIRYIVNRAGTFDLKDYLTSEDGSELATLPTFKFTGDAQLSKDLDTRIQETEEVQVEVGGRYYEILAVLTLLWIGWLFLLIFYKRSRGDFEAVDVESEPSLAEQMRGYLERIEAGTLDTLNRAKMEMALIQSWRIELSLTDQRMGESLEKISRDSETSEALRQLQHWLHHPASSVTDAEIAAVIRPYTVEEPTAS